MLGAGVPCRESSESRWGGRERWVAWDWRLRCRFQPSRAETAQGGAPGPPPGLRAPAAALRREPRRGRARGLRDPREPELARRPARQALRREPRRGPRAMPRARREQRGCPDRAVEPRPATPRPTRRMRARVGTHARRPTLPRRRPRAPWRAAPKTMREWRRPGFARLANTAATKAIRGPWRSVAIKTTRPAPCCPSERSYGQAWGWDRMWTSH